MAVATVCPVLTGASPVAAGTLTLAGARAAGTWGAAQDVAGIATLNAAGNAGIASVSCPSAGNCGAGGTYKDSSDFQQAFVVDEANGTWDAAEEVPGSATLNQGGDARVASLSRGSMGDCSAGGVYKDSSGNYQAFVVTRTTGG